MYSFNGIEVITTLADNSMWNWAAGAIATVSVIDWAWLIFFGSED